MIPPQAIALIKTLEGFSPTPTPDGNKMQIGYGHDIRPGEEFTTITEPQAEELLMSDLTIDDHFIDSYIKVPLLDNQRAALLSLVYNCGPAPLKGTLGKMLNAGNPIDAGNQFGMWVYYTKPDGTKAISDGLVKRRAIERALFLKPEVITNTGITPNPT